MATRASNGKSSTRSRALDAIAYLKADHRDVENLFKAFERSSEGALKTRRKLVDQMIVALSQHAFIEEQVLYPSARAEVSSAHDDVLEALEEHHVVKWQLQELTDLDAGDEHFNAKVAVMSENVRHHVREEESELFPLLRSNMGRKRLLELGDELRAAKGSAPKRPHPRIPAEPPEHLLPDAVSTAVDRARDMVNSVRGSS